MSTSQIIRGSKTPTNPTGLAKDILNINQKFSDAGAPIDVPGAITGNSYVDSISGIEYILQADGSWQPLVSYGSFTSIPDPLSVDQLNVNTIEGQASDSVAIDLKAAGDLEITAAGTQGIKINGTNAKIQGNGYAEFQSTVRMYEALVDNFSGRQLKVEATPDYKISVSGLAGDLAIDAGASKVKLQGSAVEAGADVDLAGNDLVNSVGDMDIINNAANQAVNISSTGAGAMNIESGGLLSVNTTSGNNASFGGNILLANSEVQRCNAVRSLAGGNLEISSGDAGANLVLQTNGGAIDCDNNDLINVSGLNNSASLTQNSLLNVSNSGALSYRAYPQSIDMHLTGFGSNTTQYFNLSNAVLNPSEVWGVCSGNGRRLAEFSLRLHYNAAWNMGGVGTCVVEIGTIANNLPMVAANFVTLRSVNVDTTADFYGVTFSGYNDAISFRSAVCARVTLAGTSSTSTNAELSLNITLV